MKTAKVEWPKLEKDGEEEVLRKVAESLYGQDRLPLVLAWLDKNRREREEAAAIRQEKREKETLAATKKANEIAEGSKKLARYALWIAIGIPVIQFIIIPIIEFIISHP